MGKIHGGFSDLFPHVFKFAHCVVAVTPVSLFIWTILNYVVSDLSNLSLTLPEEDYWQAVIMTFACHYCQTVSKMTLFIWKIFMYDFLAQRPRRRSNGLIVSAPV